MANKEEAAAANLAAIKARLSVEAPPTDTQVLSKSTRVTPRIKSVGKRSSEANLLEDIYGEQARKETGGSMDVFEQVDPRSEFTEEEAEQYLAGEKEITLPGTDTTHRLGSPKIPLAKRALTTLTDEDIYEIAEDPTFPESWQSSEDLSYSPISSFTVRSQLRQKYGINYANEYPNMSQIERAALLKTAKDLSLREESFQQTARPVLEKAGEMAVEGVERGVSILTPGGIPINKYGIPYIKEKYGDLKTFFERVGRLEQTEAELEQLRKDMELLKTQSADTVSDGIKDTGTTRP